MKSKNNKLKLIAMLCMYQLFHASIANAQLFQFNKDWVKTLSTQLCLGGTASFANGEYIDYQKEFFDVSSPNTEIKGKINPLFFFGVGLQEKFIPFQDSIMSNLSITVGVEYFQRGFVNKYKTVYTDPDIDIKDKTVFTESYHLNYLSIPFMVRWGKKWYAELGFSYDLFLTGTRKHKVAHDVSGSDAYNGGFDETSKENQNIPKDFMADHSTGILVGGGINFSPKIGMHAQLHYVSDTFKEGNDFNNYLTQLQFLFKIK